MLRLWSGRRSEGTARGLLPRAQGPRLGSRRRRSPSFRSQPSRSGLKNVCVRSLPSSSGILNGSFLMLSYRFCEEGRRPVGGGRGGGDPLRTRGGQELAPRAEAAAARAGGGARGSGPHPQQLLGEVPALVDAAVHGDKALGCGLVAHVVVVQAGVEHDDGEGQHVARVWKESGRGASAAPGKAPRAPTPRPPAPTCGLEDARVAEAVAGRERLHHAVDFLRLAGESEAPQELPAGKREPGGGAAAPRPRPAGGRPGASGSPRRPESTARSPCRAPGRPAGGRGKAAGRGQGPSALHPPPAAAWRNPRGSGPEAGG